MSPSIGLVTLNAKYVHLALSVRYLRNAARAAGFGNVWLREYTVRTPLGQMAAELVALRPDVLGFSIYIWNRERSLALIERVKRLLPAVKIVIGGPEVSFETEAPLPEIDAAIAGEGEVKWVEFLRGWADGWGTGVPGQGQPSAATRARWLRYGTDLPKLDTLPYLEEDLAGLEHRLAYLETSRGCPFSCSFCLSALDEKVRFFPEAAVKNTVERLVAAGARRIKFLDRTFNLRRSRVLDFFRFLARFDGVEFHFEVVGDLLDEPMLAFLETVPPGRFQFEIGVQSADPAVNARVQRHQSQKQLFAAMARLRAGGRVHLHADLIWGLPGEDLAAIRASFETVLALRPHQLQLGFLKFLPGAPIRALIARHGYAYDPRPPYELIRHEDLPAGDVAYLKRCSAAFERYYNSGHFRFALEALLEEAQGWELFSALAAAGGESGRDAPPLEILAQRLAATGARLVCRRPHARLTEEALRDLVKLDYFCHHRARRVPGFLQGATVAEPAGLRALRKSRPDSAYAPFAHRISWAGEPGASRPTLEPSLQPVWLEFSYADARQGYFFRPAITELTVLPPFPVSGSAKQRMPEGARA